MNERVIARLFSVRRRVAVALLVIGLVGTPIAWSLDPFVWGLFMLIVSPLQIGVAVLGIAARLWRDREHAAMSWVVDVLLLAMAIGGYAFARTISWA